MVHSQNREKVVTLCARINNRRRRLKSAQRGLTVWKRRANRAHRRAWRQALTAGVEPVIPIMITGRTIS